MMGRRRGGRIGRRRLVEKKAVIRIRTGTALVSTGAARTSLVGLVRGATLMGLSRRVVKIRSEPYPSSFHPFGRRRVGRLPFFKAASSAHCRKGKPWVRVKTPKAANHQSIIPVREPDY